MEFENVYEVIGYPVSCPEETFSEGLYRTRESSKTAMEKAIEEYPCANLKLRLSGYMGEL
jgi:hypothetical protein